MKHMPIIRIASIEHECHRYPTCGDYFDDEWGDTDIYVSRLSDWRYEFLIAVHELIECFLCKHRGIREQDVSAFDKSIFRIDPDCEPGEQRQAPYHREHMAAEEIERILAVHLGVDWKAYGNAIDDLWKRTTTTLRLHPRKMTGKTTARKRKASGAKNTRCSGS